MMITTFAVSAVIPLRIHTSIPLSHTLPLSSLLSFYFLSFTSSFLSSFLYLLNFSFIFSSYNSFFLSRDSDLHLVQSTADPVPLKFQINYLASSLKRLNTIFQAAKFSSTFQPMEKILLTISQCFKYIRHQRFWL